MRRLFAECEAVSAVIAGSYYLRVSPAESLLPCPHVSVPLLSPGGRPLSKILKYALQPFFALLAFVRIGVSLRPHRRDVVVTVAHGLLFLPTIVLARLWRFKTVLFVHDDWAGTLSRNHPFWAKVLNRVFRWAVQNASSIFVVSPEMQSWLSEECHRESTVLLPSREPSRRTVAPTERGATFNLTYLGSLNTVVRDPIEFVAYMVKAGMAERAAGRPMKFRLFTSVSDAVVREWGLDDPRIEVIPWVPAAMVDTVLAEADALLLPFSFRPENRFSVTTAFPSKVADYLTSGVPTIVLAPSYSTIAGYVQSTGAALLVQNLEEQAVGDAIAAVATCQDWVGHVVRRADVVFSANHDLMQQRHLVSTIIRNMGRAH
jgi:hypothetical protein